MAQAKWLVHIDWNDDGDFSDADEDVTEDVLGLILEHFRDLTNEHSEAVRLEIELKNDDHKYSPPNGASPLSGNLKPGRKAWVRAAYPYDGFSDSAGTQLQVHNLDYDSSFSWSEDLRNFDIASGGSGAETDSVQGNGDCVATVDFGDADVSFGCDFTRGANSSDHGGLCLRYSNTTNYLYVRVTGTAIELRKVDAGVDSQIVSAAHTWAASAQKFLSSCTERRSGCSSTTGRCWTLPHRLTAARPGTASSATTRRTTPGTISVAGSRCSTAVSTRSIPGLVLARSTATSGRWMRWSG